MTNYKPLTKIVEDSDGNQAIACIYHGTKQCDQIRKDKGCYDCRMMVAMLTQLHTFEEIYMEETNVNVNANKT